MKPRVFKSESVFFAVKVRCEPQPNRRCTRTQRVPVAGHPSTLCAGELGVTDYCYENQDIRQLKS